MIICENNRILLTLWSISRLMTNKYNRNLFIRKKILQFIKEYSYNRNLPNSYSTTVLV